MVGADVEVVREPGQMGNGERVVAPVDGIAGGREGADEGEGADARSGAGGFA